MRSIHASVGSRRKFLTQVGSLAAVAAGAPFAGGNALMHASEHGHDDDDRDDALEQRAREAYRLRV